MYNNKIVLVVDNDLEPKDSSWMLNQAEAAVLVEVVIIVWISDGVSEPGADMDTRIPVLTNCLPILWVS